MRKILITIMVLAVFFVGLCLTPTVCMAGSNASSSAFSVLSLNKENEDGILAIKLSTEAIETSKRGLSFIFESRGGFNDTFKDECRKAFYVLRHEAAKKKMKEDGMVVELSRKHIDTIESALYFILGGKDAQDATNEIRLQVARLDGEEHWMKIVDADIGPGYRSVGTDMVRTEGEDPEEMKRREEIIRGIGERFKEEQRE